jgi:hypothetical protein
LIRNVFGAIAYTLLLSAVFIDRSSKDRLQMLPTGAADPGTRERWEAGRPRDDGITTITPPPA